jgi:hypothetical protein
VKAISDQEMKGRDHLRCGRVFRCGIHKFGEVAEMLTEGKGLKPAERGGCVLQEEVWR